jgi:hypothetical protein
MKSDIILSGLVSGATILLGVLIADWLKRFRNRVEQTRRAVRELHSPLNMVADFLAGNILGGYGFANDAPLTLGEKDFFNHGYTLRGSLDDLSESPRWPQMNARKIREGANTLLIALEANVERCAAERIRLDKTEGEELVRLYFALVDLTHRYSVHEARQKRIEEKREELGAQASSRATTSA